MKRRGAARSVGNPKSLLSPVSKAASPGRSSKPSSKPYDFDLTILATSSSSKKTLASSPLLHSPSSPSNKTLTTISDLKNFFSSRSNAIKRNLDLGHSEILKEIDASHTRLSKRLKIQTQACMQLTDEVEKEYKKMSDRINENTELIKASYVDFITEAQASASRVCKVAIPDLAQSMEKALDGLRGRYKIPSAPV